MKVPERRSSKVTGARPHRKTGFVIAVALLDDVVVAALVFVALFAAGVKLDAWAIVVIGVVAGGLVFLLHHALVPGLTRRAVTGAEGMIGQAALVTDPLDPDGTVMFDGERWRARSLDGHIPAGEDVTIESVERLSLEVRRRER